MSKIRGYLIEYTVWQHPGVHKCWVTASTGKEAIQTLREHVWQVLNAPIHKAYASVVYINPQDFRNHVQNHRV